MQHQHSHHCWTVSLLHFSNFNLLAVIMQIIIDRRIANTSHEHYPADKSVGLYWKESANSEDSFDMNTLLYPNFKSAQPQYVGLTGLNIQNEWTSSSTCSTWKAFRDQFYTEFPLLLWLLSLYNYSAFFTTTLLTCIDLEERVFS